MCLYGQCAGRMASERLGAQGACVKEALILEGAGRRLKWEKSWGLIGFWGSTLLTRDSA